MSLLHDYIISLANLYGMVHKSQVLEIYNKQNKESIGIELLDSLLDTESQELVEYFIWNEGDYFVHEAVFDFEFWRELDNKIGKPFYVPSRQKLLKYKDEGYVECTKQYDDLLQYVLEHHEQNKREAIEVCKDIQEMCALDLQPEELLMHCDRLITFNNKQQIKKMMDLVLKLSNHTRKWSNNGFTLDELMTMVIEGYNESFWNFNIPFSNMRS